tara:strand:+ start:566 stop:871 length:306 start_codon:yes stop_codon:yes gene_type:complete
MVKTINFYGFVDAFQNAGRGKQFSYDGLKALFNYLEEYEEGTGEEVQLDVIALCCEYCEFDNLEEFQTEYDPAECETMEDIEERTQVIRIENSDKFIIAQF